MKSSLRIALAILFSASLLFSGWATVSPAMAAPICVGCDEMPDMPGIPDMDHKKDDTEKSGADCMVKLSCYATCAKLPLREAETSSLFYQRVTFPLGESQHFKTVTPSLEPSPPKATA